MGVKFKDFSNHRGQGSNYVINMEFGKKLFYLNKKTLGIKRQVLEVHGWVPGFNNDEVTFNGLGSLRQNFNSVRERLEIEDKNIGI